MNALLPFLITGIATGSLYGLAGLGLVITYRTSGVFNFGHGAIAAGAAFFFYSLHVSNGLSWPLAAVITLAVFGTVGALLMELITRWLGDVPGAVVVVATVGVLLAIEGFLYVQYGDLEKRFPPFLPTSGFTVDNVNITWEQVISVAVATAAAAGLYVFLKRSRLGLSMRAVVDNETLIGLTGQRATRIRTASWSIGCTFAAVSGILLAPTLGLDPNLLTLLVVQALGACAIGLFASLPLTYLGGIVVGVTASVATKYFTRPPFTGIPSTVPYLFLIVILLVIPVAKLPQRRASLRSLVPESPPLRPLAGAGLILVGGAALLLIPSLVGPKLPVWTSGLTYVVLFGSLALLVWTSGQISLCHMAFAAVGATTMAHFAHHMPWPVALVLAGLITAPIGALVAIPAIRLSGIYLALITLGFGIFMQNVVYPTFLMFGSGLTVSVARPRMGFISGSDKSYYYVVLAIATLVCVLLTAIYRGRLGRVLRAMAESPTMLSTHGLRVSVTRMIVFCIAAFVAGVGGALALTQTGTASGVGFGPIQSLLLLAVLAICGTRLLRSSILAAGLLAVVPAYVTQFGTDRQTLVFGLAAIAASLIIARRSELSAWLAQGTADSEARQSLSRVAGRHSGAEHQPRRHRARDVPVAVLVAERVGQT